MNTPEHTHSGPARVPFEQLHRACVGGLSNAGVMGSVMLRMLDEIDYGLLLVTPTGCLRYANQLALRSLTGTAALRLGDGKVYAAKDAEQTLLRAALSDAGRGLRRLLTLQSAGTSVAVLPIPADDDGACTGDASELLVMLVLGKQPANETLTVAFFARTQRLTAAESTVLHGLCGGLRPKEIANQAGVQISTVRSQIGSIRIKTETASIRDLVNRVAALPPITPALKAAPTH